jgi:hypothetical protein
MSKRGTWLAVLAGLAALGCTVISGVAGLHEVNCAADCGAPETADAPAFVPETDAPSSDDGGEAGIDSGAPDGGSLDDGSPDAAAEAMPPLIFDEEFDGGSLDTTSRWTAAGSGSWGIDGGVGVQVVPDATASLLYAQAFTQGGDYHIIARMASGGPFVPNQDLATEIAFRVDPTLDAGALPTCYHCNVDLFLNQLVIQETSSSGTPILASATLPFPTGFELSTPFVLDTLVSGTNATCSVTFDGLGQLGSVSTSALARPTGSFGLKTYASTATFFYFRVYATQ